MRPASRRSTRSTLLAVELAARCRCGRPRQRFDPTVLVIESSVLVAAIAVIAVIAVIADDGPDGDHPARAAQ